MYDLRCIKKNKIVELEITFKTKLSKKNFNQAHSELIKEFNNIKFLKPYKFNISEEIIFFTYNYFKSADFTFEKTIELVGSISKRIPIYNYGHNFSKQYSNLRFLFLDFNDFKFMYNYQLKGSSWLIEGESKLLADDMGLGKTLQSIIALVNILKKLKNLTPILILCPNTLSINWLKEINLWAPFVNVSIVENIDFKENLNLLNKMKTNNVIIVNYEKLEKLTDYCTSVNLEFPLIIADEAHRLRRSESSLYKYFFNLKTNKTWMLSGTPLEKDEKDVKNILSLLDKKNKSLYESEVFLNLKNKLQKFSLRRNKLDVIKELPSKHESLQFVELNKDLRKKYQSLQNEYFSSSREKKISFLNRFLAICIESKFETTVDLLEKYINSNSKIVIFSFLTEPLKKFFEFLPRSYRNKSKILTGENTTEEREKIIFNFQNSKDIKILLISSMVGSVGITLTKANVAIFLSEYWNPSSNRQAEDRLLRIGQKKDVYIIKLRANATIEENLQNIFKEKNNLTLALDKALMEKSGS